MLAILNAHLSSLYLFLKDSRQKLKTPRLNINQKFFAYLMLVSILPLIIVGLLSYEVARNTLKEEASKYTIALLNDQREYLDLQLDQIESLLANISGVEEIRNTLEDKEAGSDVYANLLTQARIGYILNGYSDLKGLVSIDIFTIDGAHYHVGDTLNIEDIRTDTRDNLFAEALQSDQLVLWAGIEENVNANSSHDQVVSAAKVLKRVNRDLLQEEPVALFLVNYSADYLYRHFSQIDLGSGAYLIVVDAKNRIIYHPDQNLVGETVSSSFMNLLSEEQGSVTNRVNGEEMLISYTRSDKSGWLVLSLIPIATMNAKASVIGMALGLMLLVSFIIVALVAGLYNRKVVAPIREITRRFQNFQEKGLTEQERLVPASDDEVGELVQWFNTFTETLVARQSAEQALQESEKQYRSIFESATDGFIIATLDGYVVEANPAVCRMHGYTYDEFVGSHLSEFTLPDFDVEVAVFVSMAQADNQQTTAVTNLRRDGTPFEVEVRGAPITYKGELHLLAIIRDVTERRQTEEALRRAQKLESLGVMAGGVAHDFNNLLVAMLGQTSLALKKLPPDNPAQPHVAKAVKAAERAADLTRQLLAYSGRGKFEVQLLNLNTLIQDNLHLFEVAIAKNITLRSVLASDLPLVHADPGQMQQVVMNLIINGAEAIGTVNGTVTVTTGTKQVAIGDEQLWRHTGDPLLPGRYVTVEIQDDGCGMDADTVSRIFDPFFTTKFTGRGLGLAAVLGIVRGHEGGLQVISQVGRGTTFRLFFPTVSMEETKLASPHGNFPAANGHQDVVLVIDDEEPVRDAVSDILGILDLEVITAANGRAGVEIFKAKADTVRLVLLDLSMPGLSGEETCMALREIRPDVPVLLSSGYSQTEVDRRLPHLEISGFLQKPYDMDRLLEAVRGYLH